MKISVKPPKSVFISGQKYFGAQVYRLCKSRGLNIIGVCSPKGDKYLRRLAALDGVRVVDALNGYSMPDVDLGVAAHSFDYIGSKTRRRASLGWLSYHPSLLPRHRGRSSIEWAVRMKDPITGGSTFWLNSGIDRGDIFLQDWVFIDPKYLNSDPKKAAADIWRADLLPMGERLMGASLDMLLKGEAIKIRQDARFSTFEPSTDVKDVFKPDLLALPPPRLKV